MCCCKLHLHARWSISALIECAKKQGIQIDFDTYDTFFNYQHILIGSVHLTKNVTVKLKGAIVKRLRALSTDANVEFILDFISNLLPKIINHRNQLKHYRHSIKTFHELNIDIDFSENLSVPVKYEPQSLHWSHKQVTIHSGILKLNGEKSYHPYISEDRQHDQSFVKIVIEEMLNTVNKNLPGICVINLPNIFMTFSKYQINTRCQY